MKIDRKLKIATLLVASLVALLLFNEYKHGREIKDLEIRAEAHANSPECYGLPFRASKEPVKLDSNTVISLKELNKGAEIAKKCWKARVEYIIEKSK